MFNYKHYVPLLRWKAAEKGALRNLNSKTKEMITPLIEFIMPQPKELKNPNSKAKTPKELLSDSIIIFQKSLNEIPDQVFKYWGKNMVFVDVQLLDASIRAKSLSVILNGGKQLDLFMVPVISIIPVVGFESDANTRKVAVDFVKTQGHGLCIRVSVSDFAESSLSKDLENFLSKNNLSAKKTDLLIDLKIVDMETPYNQLVDNIKNIPHLQEWRTFTVASGAFPKDLSQFEKHGQYFVPRTDWKLWNKLVKMLPRTPSFSDYTIQHPIHNNPVTASNPSASIRYALNEEWLIERGEGLRNRKGKGFKQYPALARLLTSQDKLFKGAVFSQGDQYIAEKSINLDTRETGNPKTWLEAGINHHLTLVADQLSSLV